MYTENSQLRYIHLNSKHASDLQIFKSLHQICTIPSEKVHTKFHVTSMFAVQMNVP